MASARILYCHCAHARVVPDRVKNEVLDRLAAAGVPFEAVADLCEMAARRDPALRQLAGDPAGEGAGPLRIAACFPRAVQWLFASGGAPLPPAESAAGPCVANMRTATADEVVHTLLEGVDAPLGGAALSGGPPGEET